MLTLALPAVDLALADQGAGRPVVLVHGFPMDHSIWARQVQSLAPHYRVITPDLRGSGRSSVTPGKVTVQQWADDLAAMLDALKIGEPIVLGGLSMGGYVALRFFEAHRSRLAGLILCDTKAAADTPQAAAGRLETAQRLEREGGRFLADAMPPRLLAAATLQRQPEVVDRLRQVILAGEPAGYAATLRGPGRAAGLHAAAAADRLPHAADRGAARCDFHRGRNDRHGPRDSRFADRRDRRGRTRHADGSTGGGHGGDGGVSIWSAVIYYRFCFSRYAATFLRSWANCGPPKRYNARRIRAALHIMARRSSIGS